MATRNSVKETEKPHNRSSNKSKQTTKQAQEKYLAKHINSNGPQDQEPVDPMDFESLPVEVLNRYKRKFNLDCPEAMTDYGEMANSDVGSKTYSLRNQQRITKKQLAEIVKRHFLNQTCKESDVIANFIYTVNNEDKAFKLTF